MHFSEESPRKEWLPRILQHFPNEGGLIVTDGSNHGSGVFGKMIRPSGYLRKTWGCQFWPSREQPWLNTHGLHRIEMKRVVTAVLISRKGQERVLFSHSCNGHSRRTLPQQATLTFSPNLRSARRLQQPPDVAQLPQAELARDHRAASAPAPSSAKWLAGNQTSRRKPPGSNQDACAFAGHRPWALPQWKPGRRHPYLLPSPQLPAGWR